MGECDSEEECDGKNEFEGESDGKSVAYTISEDDLVGMSIVNPDTLLSSHQDRATDTTTSTPTLSPSNTPTDTATDAVTDTVTGNYTGNYTDTVTDTIPDAVNVTVIDPFLSSSPPLHAPHTHSIHTHSIHTHLDLHITPATPPHIPSPTHPPTHTPPHRSSPTHTSTHSPTHIPPLPPLPFPIIYGLCPLHPTQSHPTQTLPLKASDTHPDTHPGSHPGSHPGMLPGDIFHPLKGSDNIGGQVTLHLKTFAYMHQHLLAVSSKADAALGLAVVALRK